MKVMGNKLLLIYCQVGINKKIEVQRIYSLDFLNTEI